ncbi:unnamed protein product, partial [Larinioides sclopetarius]
FAGTFLYCCWLRSTKKDSYVKGKTQKKHHITKTRTPTHIYQTEVYLSLVGREHKGENPW